jgi:inorganic pyrophosphatase
MMKIEARQEAQEVIGKTFHIQMDRPIGTKHPKHPEILYPINYGYIPGLLGGDAEEQDVYVLDSKVPLQEADVTIIAVIYREDDIETKWVGVVDPKQEYTDADILDIVHFQEQFYTSHVIRE